MKKLLFTIFIEIILVSLVLFCYFATAQKIVTGCFDCTSSPQARPCCFANESCGETLGMCCGTCKSGNCGCHTKCVTQCENKECGSGGCTPNDCGICKTGYFCHLGKCVANNQCVSCTGYGGVCCSGNETCPDGSTCCGTSPTPWTTSCTLAASCPSGARPMYRNISSCQCRDACQCVNDDPLSVSGCAGCPSVSPGCASNGCSCLGPQNASSGWSKVRPSCFWIFQSNEFNAAYTCDVSQGSYYNGVGPSTWGDKGGGGRSATTMFVSLPPNSQSEHIFIDFGSNTSWDPHGHVFITAQLATCQKNKCSDFTDCSVPITPTNDTCCNQFDSTCSNIGSPVNSYAAQGQGVWLKKPASLTTFQVLLNAVCSRGVCANNYGVFIDGTKVLIYYQS